jgi:hypothetical protein
MQRQAEESRREASLHIRQCTQATPRVPKLNVSVFREGNPTRRVF